MKSDLEAAREILDKKGGSPISFPMMRALKQEPDLDLIHLHTGNRLGGIGRLVARSEPRLGQAVGKSAFVRFVYGGVLVLSLGGAGAHQP